MSKRLIIVLALAFVLGISFAAYAEVQNVKVSGDLTVQGVTRNNFDLTKTPGFASNGFNSSASEFDDEESYILSIARVRVDADLTDNVSTTVRLLNERAWNGESNAAGTRNRNIGLNTGLTPTDENDIDLDLAYVSLKEFLYSPLSLTVGRQELRFGNAFIVGDPDTNIYASRGNLADGDLSARKSFDAIKATLDYNPLVVTGVFAKIEEGNEAINDDVTLAGVNASYELDKATTLEGFLFSKIKQNNAAAVTNLDAVNASSFLDNTETDTVNTIGARVVNKSVNNLTLDAQAAYQFGQYNPRFDPNAAFFTSTNKAESVERNAWAAQTIATYDLKDIALVSKYAPVISGHYTYLSGAERDRRQDDDSYKGWDPMFEDQTYGHIMNAIIANTNMHRAGVSVNAKIIEDLTANVDWVIASFAKKFPDGRRVILSGVSGARSFRIDNNRASIGQEIDAKLTYDYTEDVQFSLLGGIFLPNKSIQGNTVSGPSSKTDLKVAATELIGSMKVTF